MNTSSIPAAEHRRDVLVHDLALAHDAVQLKPKIAAVSVLQDLAHPAFGPVQREHACPGGRAGGRQGCKSV